MNLWTWVAVISGAVLAGWGLHNKLSSPPPTPVPTFTYQGVQFRTITGTAFTDEQKGIIKNTMDAIAIPSDLVKNVKSVSLDPSAVVSQGKLRPVLIREIARQIYQSSALSSSEKGRWDQLFSDSMKLDDGSEEKKPLPSPDFVNTTAAAPERRPFPKPVPIPPILNARLPMTSPSGTVAVTTATAHPAAPLEKTPVQVISPLPPSQYVPINTPAGMVAIQGERWMTHQPDQRPTAEDLLHPHLANAVANK